MSPLSIGSSTPLPFRSIKDDGERHSSLLEIQREELVIMERLSSGGFSTVYRGEWRYTGIAIKVLRCKVDDKAYLSLQTELAVMSQLRHPRILTLMGVCRDLDMLDGTVALIMEHMERGSLHGILHDDTNIPYGPSNCVERLRYTLDIADGMRFLHKSGVVHRDLKSANVLVGSDNHAKIADFGLSSYHEQAQTLVTNVISTPAYSSPEVIRGEGAITASADVFSFGVILWELLTGLSPWEGKTTVQIIFMSMQGTSLALPPQIRSDNPELADLMDRCFDIPTSRPRFSDIYYEVSILFSELINGKVVPTLSEGSPEHTKHEVTKSIARKVLRRLSGTTLEKDITGMGDGALAEERKRTATSKSSNERKTSSSSSSAASSVDVKRSVTSSSSEKIRSSSVLKATPSDEKRSVSSSIIGRLRSSSVLNPSSSNDRRPISIASQKSEEAPSSSGVTLSVPVFGEEQDQNELSSPMTGLSSPITDLPSPMSVGSNIERTSSVCSIEKINRTTADSSPMKERRGISEFKTSERASDTTPERVRLVSYLLGESLSPPEMLPEKVVRRVVKVVSEKTKNGITESALPVSDIILNRAPRPPSAGPEKYGRKVNKSILEEAERRVLGTTHSMYEMNPRKMEALDINRAENVSTEIVTDENIKAARRVSGRVLLKNGRLPGELDNRVKGSPEENADEKLTRKHSEYSMENVGWGGRWARSMNEEDDY